MHALHIYFYRDISISISIYLSIYLSIHLHISISRFESKSISQSINLSVYLYIYELIRFRCGETRVGLYTILFCLWVCVHESILFSAHLPFVQAPNPSVIAHTITQCNVSPRPRRYCNIYHTILAVTILCKGQTRTAPRRRRWVSGASAYVSIHLSIDLAFRRYCHHQYCMVYGMGGGVGGRA